MHSSCTAYTVISITIGPVCSDKAQTVTKHCSLGKVRWSAECFTRNVRCVHTSKDIWLLLSARIQLEVKPEGAICQRRWLEINTLMENYGKIELLYIM